MHQRQYLLELWKSTFNCSKRVLHAFEMVDRCEFVLPELVSMAYEDTPLPILRGKTISQPTTVMLMTSLLALKPGEKVLEIGTGSGYQTALLSKLVGRRGHVFSTEILPELVQFSRENLSRAGITNCTLIEDDGSKGLADYAPFDKIIITAACKEFPKPLLDQLAPKGIILAPVGNASEQELVRGINDKPLSLEFFGQYMFSSLYGEYGFEE